MCVCVYGIKAQHICHPWLWRLVRARANEATKKASSNQSSKCFGFCLTCTFSEPFKAFPAPAGLREVRGEGRVAAHRWAGVAPKTSTSKSRRFPTATAFIWRSETFAGDGLERSEGRSRSEAAGCPPARPPVLPSTRLGCPLPVGTATEALLLPLPHWRSKSAKAGNHTASFRCAGALLPAAVRRPTLLMQHT